MKKIKELAEHIRSQICDAEQYARLAVAYKETDLKLGECYYNLSKAELDHAGMEHDQAARIIKEYQQSGQTVPSEMQAVWQWQHERMIEDKAEILIMLSMFR